LIHASQSILNPKRGDVSPDSFSKLRHRFIFGSAFSVGRDIGHARWIRLAPDPE
jgi:hypothetical protein